MVHIDLRLVIFCFIAMFISLALDLISGVQKAKRNKKLRVSVGYRMSVQKFLLYFGSMILALLVDFIVIYAIEKYSSFIPALPYFLMLITVWQVFTEFKSIRENASVKLLKSTNKSASELLKLVTALKNHDIINVLKELSETQTTDNQ